MWMQHLKRSEFVDRFFCFFVLWDFWEPFWIFASGGLSVILLEVEKIGFLLARSQVGTLEIKSVTPGGLVDRRFVNIHRGLMVIVWVGIPSQ